MTLDTGVSLTMCGISYDWALEILSTEMLQDRLYYDLKHNRIVHAHLWVRHVTGRPTAQNVYGQLHYLYAVIA